MCRWANRVFLLAAFAPATMVAQFSEGPRYLVSISPESSSVTVRLELPAGATRLVMDSIQAEQLDQGWATYVRDLTVSDRDGPVALTREGPTRWRLPGSTRGPVLVQYRVDYGFAHEPWPVGNEQAAQWFPDALYTVGKPMFIESDAPGPRHVVFALPPGWHASVPWSPAPDGGFLVPDATTLVRNTLVLGAHPSVRFTDGPLDLELALPGADEAAGQAITPVLRAVLQSAVAIFDGTPSTRYLMTFFQSYADDGEGFDLGGTFTSATPPRADAIPVWGNSLAHELLHFWNGRRIRGAGARSTWRWFAEGFTEYYANVLLARAGVFSPALFRWKAERHLGNYLYFMASPLFGETTLEQAGRQTGTYRFGAYDGGWALALCLDGRIREGSGDRHSLDDVMRELWHRARDGEPGYTVASIDSLVARLTGESPDGFVPRFVQGRETLPLDRCLARFALRAATKGYAAEVFLGEVAGDRPGTLRRAAAFGH